MLPQRVIGRQFPSLESSSDFGIKMILLLLMKAEVSPEESIARNARRSVGVVSSTFSWKNSIGKPS